MTKIVQKGDNVLRRIAAEVPAEDIGSEKLNKIIAEMASALDGCDDGVALAAPQIGRSLRIFIVSPKVFKGKLVYINPVIAKKSSKKSVLDEGCLSVRGIFGKIERHDKVTVAALDETGARFTRGTSGLLAEIFQHEVDHLNGILFTDSATNLVKIENKQPKDDAPKAQVTDAKQK